jgi:hypothetical protein
MADRATIIGRPTVTFRNPVHRPCRLHLLTGADRIAFLEQLRESRTGAVRYCVLQFLRQIRECHVWVDRLDIAQELVRKPACSRLERGDSIEHSREKDRLHHFGGGSLHGS